MKKYLLVAAVVWLAFPCRADDIPPTADQISRAANSAIVKMQADFHGALGTCYSIVGKQLKELDELHEKLAEQKK